MGYVTQHLVSIELKYAEPGQLKCDNPQESVQGSLMFFVYINERLQTFKCEA